MKAVTTAIEKFMEAWSDNDKPAMHELCTETYKVGHPIMQIGSILSGHVSEVKIGKPKKSTDVVFDVPVTVKHNGKSKKLTARLVCETAPFKPSKKGKWGVNPISVSKGLAFLANIS